MDTFILFQYSAECPSDLDHLLVKYSKPSEDKKRTFAGRRNVAVRPQRFFSKDGFDEIGIRLISTLATEFRFSERFHT